MIHPRASHSSSTTKMRRCAETQKNSPSEVRGSRLRVPCVPVLSKFRDVNQLTFRLAPHDYYRVVPGAARGLSSRHLARSVAVEPHRERIRKMPWQVSGSNRWVNIGKYTSSDGYVFDGVWISPTAQDPPPDPPGLPPNNDQPHQQPWQGSYDANGVWTGKYTEPDGTLFYGTMSRQNT